MTIALQENGMAVVSKTAIVEKFSESQPRMPYPVKLKYTLNKAVFTH